MPSSDNEAFISQVWEMGLVHARPNLPWRHTQDAYAIYVSEVMLQQTQVSRVLKYWSNWMKTFPSVDALAAASTSDVLACWQGLGYNKRALNMHRCAQMVSGIYAGCFPEQLDQLLELPGVGPATAAGIYSFAFNKPSVYIETNVRTVYIHHFFSESTKKIPDAKLVPLVRDTCSTSNPRNWYYALLDYGAYLKSVGSNAARKSASYSRQSPFEGSNRQKRSFIVREVLAGSDIAEDEVLQVLNAHEHQAGRADVDIQQFNHLLDQLEREGFFMRKNGRLLA